MIHSLLKKAGLTSDYKAHPVKETLPATFILASVPTATLSALATGILSILLATSVIAPPVALLGLTIIAISSTSILLAAIITGLVSSPISSYRSRGYEPV